MKKVRVLVAGDHKIVPQGLPALLHVEQDIEIVSEAETGRQAVQLAKTLEPDIVLIDTIHCFLLQIRFALPSGPE
jgi:YesN/AraC family two-component response regulator